jgi:hypothetical protein
MEIKHEDFLAIINAGILAPSADNSQPWKFKIDVDAIRVSYDPTRVGMFFDSALSATYMSLGAVCENMQLQAEKLGYLVEVELHNLQAVAKNPVFTLHLVAVGASRPALADAIASRMTNRFPYRRNAVIDTSVLSDIDSCTRPEHGCHVRWANNLIARRQLMKAVMLADLVRFTQPQIHHDFHEKLHFGRDALASRDGLASATLGLEKPLLPLLKLLKPWPLSNALNKLGLHHIMAWRGGWLPMWASSNIGIIVAKPDVSYFSMGRAFQRVWLATTHAKLAFQPFGALSLHFFRLKEEDGEGLTAHHRQLLAMADHCWRTALNEPAENRLAMIFRVGRAKHTPEQSTRREAALFLE